MSKVNNINIKLEVFKDNSSGKLSIMAHFDSNAPNVFEEKDGIFWMPTVEENELLNDAFQFIGITLNQKAGNDAEQGLGITFNQKAGNDAMQWVGFSFRRVGKTIRGLSICPIKENL